MYPPDVGIYGGVRVNMNDTDALEMPEHDGETCASLTWHDIGQSDMPECPVSLEHLMPSACFMPSAYDPSPISPVTV